MYIMLNNIREQIRTLVFCLTCLALPATADTEFKTGDLIFQPSQSEQSLAIAQATGSRYSHMGMLVVREGRIWVLEATAQVRYTPLATWIAAGVDGHYVVKRLRNGPLDAVASERITRAAEGYLGKAYDRFFDWSDEQMYCSELVWKLYQRTLGIEIGALRPLKDFHVQAPEVRKKLQERYGQAIPWNEPMIAPGDMFASKLLQTVISATAQVEIR